MRLLRLLILIIGSSACIGDLSSQTFHKRINVYGSDTGTGFSVEHDDEGNIMIFYNASWEDTMYYYGSKMGMLRLTPEGIPLDTAMFPLPLYATYTGWSDASFKRAAGSFVVGGGVQNVMDMVHRPALYFFSPSGQPDSSFVLDMGNQTWIGRHVVETSDGNFLLCGEKFGGDAFIMKISPAQEVLWSWAGGGPSVDYATSVAEDVDGNYYMGGAKEFSGSNRDFWVKAFASDGTQLWDTTFGSPFLENVAYVRIASDGDLLVAGGYAIQTGSIRVKYIGKLNRFDGSVIWERWYGPGGFGGSILSLKELSNGDLIGAGGHVIGPDYVGVMVRTTSEGDSLWMRTYYYQDSLTTTGKGIFRDVEPTPDGGFVAVGIAIAVTGIYPHALWAVKVDEHGCIEPGCHIITGMETQITNMRDVLKVWPNPSAGGPVNVGWELPEHFKPQGGLRITITTSDGRLVHEESISPLPGRGAGGEGNPQRSRRVTLSPSHLSSGLYHIHLCDASRWISGAKLVVE